MSTMLATVKEIHECAMLVCCCESEEEVLVNTSFCPCRQGICPGDRVCIHYSGAMTRSIPPQITACRVQKVSSCGC